jgi:hypothetical protein
MESTEPFQYVPLTMSSKIRAANRKKPQLQKNKPRQKFLNFFFDVQTVAVEGHLGTAGKAGRISEHYVKLLDNNIWIYKKKSDLAPVKHVDLADATQILRKGAGGEFTVEFGAERSPLKFKAFSEDDFKLWGGAINAQIKQSKQGPPPKKVIDVMFLDGSKFPMTIDTANTTAEDVRHRSDFWCFSFAFCEKV